MRYKHHKPINKVCKLWGKLKLRRAQLVALLIALTAVIFVVVTMVQHALMSPPQRLISDSQRKVETLLAVNSFNKSVFLRHLGASNNSRLKLWVASVTYSQIGQPNINKQAFESKVKDKTKVAKFLEETENWENQEQTRGQEDMLGRLNHAVSLAENLKNYAKSNPDNLNHNGLVKLNAKIQDDNTIGTLQSEKTIRNISARLLAEHEHYQSFKDKARWATRSKDLKLELSTALDQDWQNWLASRKTNLETYHYNLGNLASVTD